MRKKYAIYSPDNNVYFAGSGLDGAYFGEDNIRYFDSEKEAEDRLNEELAYMTSPFLGVGNLLILPFYTFD